MGKRNTDWTQEKYNRFIKEGRGQGEGKEYKPWLTIQDFPSIGRATRIFGWKARRIHHFFTDTETRLFYLLEWEENVIDIREHFPLLDIDGIIGNKEGINFDHFKDRGSDTPYVICTSFLITIKDSLGNKSYVARSLKASSELEKKSTLERLELERRYWGAKGINWGIITQKDIPVIRAKNIEWIHSSLFDENEIKLSIEEIKELEEVLTGRIATSSKSMRSIAVKFDKDYTLENGTGLFILKRLIANKIIRVDMDKSIDLNLPADSLIVNDCKDGRGKYAVSS